MRRVALGHDRVDQLLERHVVGQCRDVDARDHHLVDALLAKLEHGADHLLLLGLDDSLLAATLDDDHQLLGGELLALRVGDAEQARDGRRDRGQEPYERGEDATQKVDRAGEQERHPFRVGISKRLGHELTEDDREQRHEAGDDQQGDQLG